MITVHQVRIDEVAAAEADRVKSLTVRVMAITDLGRELGGLSSLLLAARLADLGAITLGTHWEEFEGQATTALTGARTRVLEAIAEQEKREAEQAELKALRAETEKLRAAEAERQRQDEERAAAELKAKLAEEQAAEDARQAEVAAIQAKEREEAAQQRAEEMATKAAAEAEARVKREAEEQAAAKARAEQAAAADAENRQRVHTEIERALIEFGLEEHKHIVEALAGGTIPHVKIIY